MEDWMKALGFKTRPTTRQQITDQANNLLAQHLAGYPDIETALNDREGFEWRKALNSARWQGIAEMEQEEYVRLKTAQRTPAVGMGRSPQP